MKKSIDLKFNYPSVSEELLIIRQYFSNDFGRETKDFLAFPPFHGDVETIELGLDWLKVPSGLYPNLIDAVLCNSANQALMCLLQSLRKQYSVIITEPFTYVSFKSIALENQFELFPCEVDEHGITLEGLDRIVKKKGAKLLYIQPTIQNPTCVLMPIERRKEIVRYALEHNLLIIEDDAYRFMCTNPPQRFLDLIPEQTIHIFSLSKPFNPLIKTTFVVMPKYLKSIMTEYIRMSSSGNSSVLTGFTNYLLRTNLLEEIIEKKQQLAKTLQDMIQPILEGLTFRTNPTCSHIWIELPSHIKATDLVNQLALQQINVTNGNEFAIDDSVSGENYIRIALGGEKDSSIIKSAVNQIVKQIKT